MCVWVFIASVPIGYVSVRMVVIISEMFECIYIFQIQVSSALCQFIVYIACGGGEEWDGEPHHPVSKVQ